MLLVLLGALPTFAAEGNSFSVDVYARYIQDAQSTVSVPVKNGLAGTDVGISVSGASEKEKRLVVLFVTQNGKEAWAWLSDCLSGIGTLIQAFDIYFLDADGNRLNVDGVTVAIACPENAEDLIVCAITADGTVVELESVIRDGKVVFTANGSHYYALVRSARVSIHSIIQSVPGQVSAYLHSEDGVMLLLWIGVLIALLAALLLFNRREQRKK